MPIDDCLRELGEKLTEGERYEVLEELDRRGRARERQRPSEGRGEAMRGAAEELAREEQLKAIIFAVREAKTVRALQNSYGLVTRWEDTSKGLFALLVGLNDPVAGGRLSIDARFKSIRARFLGGLIKDLEAEGVFQQVKSRHIDREIMEELFEFREGGEPGISGNAEALKAASVAHKYFELSRVRQNRAGAWIRELQGYAGRQTHDPRKLEKAGFDRWMADTVDKLDWERTFKGEDQDIFMKEAYRDLVSGEQLIAEGLAEEFKVTGLSAGPLAEKVSEPRILYFKDAANAFDYNKQYGRFSFIEGMVHQLSHGARNTALMEAFGPDPEKGFKRLQARLLTEARATDKPKISQRLRRKGIEFAWKEVSGQTRIAGNHFGAKIGAGYRAWKNMSVLGLATISSISDIPMAAAELRYQGHNLLSGYMNQFARVLKGRGSRDQREIARQLGVGFDGMIGQLYARLSAVDDLPGNLAKMQTWFFKANLLEWWTDAHKVGATLMMSNHLARQRTKPWAQLDESLRRVLSLFDINEREWGAIAQLARREADGRIYISPDSVRELDVVAIRDIYPELKRVTQRREVNEFGESVYAPPIEEAKTRLEDKLRAYFTDRADYAVPTPGAREQVMMKMGTQPGTIVGEVLRLFFQFKGFPMAAMSKIMGRELHGKARPDILGMVHVMIGTTVMGFLSFTAKDIVKNRTPRDPNDWKTWAAAMVQGGGAGILGDFLFAETNRFGRSFWGSMGGPAMGNVEDVWRIISRIKAGDDVAASLFYTMINNTPFINLFYTRAALDMLILYEIQDWLNPGYFRRAEGRMQRERGQGFFIPPRKFIRR